MHATTQLATMRELICKRFYNIFLKLSAISIDGFKRERYNIKINFLAENIKDAQRELMVQE